MNLPARSGDPVAAPLPMSWYFDPAVFEAERMRVFAPAPRYVGHERMVPGPGDYQVLEWTDPGRVLVRNARGVELLSNVCRHRQAKLLEGRGSVRNIVCRLHRWTYDLDGRLLGAPQFDECPEARLAATPLTDWRGLLFAGGRDVAKDLADFPLAHEFDWSNYVLDRVDAQDYPFNWKAFLEVYLELYHVDAMHPGVRRFVDAGNYRWQFGERWSNQVMGVYDGLRTHGTPAYETYQRLLLEYRKGVPPKYGTLWFIYYPNVMLEWYPEALVVSTLVPRSPELTTNVVEFYYPEEIFHFEREIVEAHGKAYLETAAEDGEVCERMHRGRHALWRAGIEDTGPYHRPLEDGMVHFHAWLRAQLERPA